MLPAGSSATVVGLLMSAEVAGPPSPEKPATPVPAMVEMMPVTPLTSRMRPLLESAMKRSPAASTAMPKGRKMLEDVAWPPSPA